MDFDAIQERAQDIGRLISQTDEYQAVSRANRVLGDDRDALTLMNRLAELDREITSHLQAGREPTQEMQDEYTSAAEKLQQQSGYQAFVAAQANFERLMARINEEIARGIEAGEQSRIILP